jgi:hypothetical protein
LESSGSVQTCDGIVLRSCQTLPRSMLILHKSVICQSDMDLYLRPNFKPRTMNCGIAVSQEIVSEQDIDRCTTLFVQLLYSISLATDCTINIKDQIIKMH